MVDDKTMELYRKLKTRERRGPGIPLPEVLCDSIIEDGFWDEELWSDGIKTEVHGKSNLYGEWFRCYGYMVFGYGNLSNNDRRRNGLPAKRWR